jgi:hypothetical protein
MNFFFINERKGILLYLELSNKFLQFSQFPLRTKNVYPVQAVRKDHAVKII